MCPIPPISAFANLAQDASAPANIREVAVQYLRTETVQAAIDTAQSTVSKPSTGNSGFTCTIYSMNNKVFPEHIASEEHTKVDIVKGEIKDGKRNAAAIMELPGDLVQKDSQIYPTKLFAPNPDGSYPADDCRQKTYDHFHTVWQFYKTCFGRNSIDGQGLEIRATIHIGRAFDNAYWSRDQDSMFFGDGGRFDGRGWLGAVGLTKDRNSDYLTNWHAPYSLDIIGHELTHGVVKFTASLGTSQTTYGAYMEAATLNEHIADCFGIMAKHFSNNQMADQGNWDMGTGWYSQTAMDAHGWKENYMRTFRVPANKATQADKGPKSMKDITIFGLVLPFSLFTVQDPHQWVGIPNQAFYLAALEFCKQTKSATWENVGKIWYNSLVDPAFKEGNKQTFRGWRDLTIQHAERLFGSQGKTIMTNAWQGVGL